MDACSALTFTPSGSQTLPRDGTKGAHADDIMRADHGGHSDDATYTNNNTLKRPGSRAREGYGSVRERDVVVTDGGRVAAEREAPISNTGRRPNGKISGQQIQQQQPVQVKEPFVFY